jgi:hypothetical protein
MPRSPEKQRPPAGEPAGEQNDQAGRSKRNSGVRQAQVTAARNLADRTKRLSLRASGHGRVDPDDLLDVVHATGIVVGLMLADKR